MAITTGTAIALGATAVAGAGASMYSARQQRKAAGQHPDFAGAHRDALQAEIDLLPARYAADREFMPKFDALAMASQDRTAEASLKTMDRLEEEYGGRFVERMREHLKLADPSGFRAREMLAAEVMKDLAAGGDLSDDERREVQQAVRGGQVARGNVLGPAAVHEEAMETGDAAFRRRQQRLGNVGSFLAGTSPAAQFGALTAAQQGAAPFAPASTGPAFNTQGVGQAAGQIFGAQEARHQAQMNQPNPWMQGLGMVVGAGTSLYGSHMKAKAWAGQAGGTG